MALEISDETITDNTKMIKILRSVLGSIFSEVESTSGNSKIGNLIFKS
jgi:hypothetical protein